LPNSPELTMCDDNSLDDMLDEIRSNSDVSRRRFGALTLGTGLTMMLPLAANAVDVAESDVELKTPDGTCDAYFAHPAKGAHAGVLMWPDAGGLRPAFRQMGKRLAQSGYSVLVPNPFYRTRRAATGPMNFQDPVAREAMMATMRSLNPTTNVTDASAFVAWLDSQPSVNKRRKLATTGYCMGGPMTMRTAAAFPGRIGAAASFHGGGLVTDTPDSPHRLVPTIKAQYLFAIAENDDQRQPEAKNVLREAFAKARLKAEVEVYAGAQHGWCPPDGAVYNEAQAERAWGRMLVLFKRALA
jgi:carboxymethylenebutenolidase